MRKNALASIVLCGIATAAAAETAYVTDSLRLGLHRAEDTSDQPMESLVSGTALEVLERNPSYARVRTPGGQEGWVKAAYLVDLKPAQARVAELESELAGLRAEVTAAADARSVAEEQVLRLGEQAAANAAVEETLGRLRSENAAYEQRLERYRGSLPLPWVAGALVVTLVAGFLAGLWWLDALIRRRHGGFRIY